MPNRHAVFADALPVSACHSHIAQTVIKMTEPIENKLPTITPPSVTKVRELAIDSLPSTKVREFARVHDFFAIMNPGAIAAAPA